MFAGLDRRQRLLVFERLALAFLARLLVEHLIAQELHHRARGAEQVLSRGGNVEVHRRRIEHGRRHLACHEALPDELIELELFRRQLRLYRLGRPGRVGWTNAFVRVLRVGFFGGAVEHRRLGEELRRVLVGQPFARRRHRARRHTRRVGAHVRDESNRALGPTHLDAFVQVLCKPHGALRAVPELLGGFLLQRAGLERFGRILPALAPLDVGDVKRLARHEILDDAIRLLGVRDFGLQPVDVMELGTELRAIVSQRGNDGPVFHRVERTNVALALHQEPQRHRLHTTGREALLDRLPEHRTRLVPDKPIEHATRLLRINFLRINVTGVFDGPDDGFLRDFVEQHALDDGRTLALDLRLHVPRDGFTLTVRVGRDVDGLRGARRLLQFGDGLFLSGNRDVLRVEPILEVNTERLGGEIANVPNRRLHGIAGAQVLPNRLRFRRRFDDDERLTIEIDRCRVFGRARRNHRCATRLLLDRRLRFSVGDDGLGLRHRNRGSLFRFRSNFLRRGDSLLRCGDGLLRRGRDLLRRRDALGLRRSDSLRRRGSLCRLGSSLRVLRGRLRCGGLLCSCLLLGCHVPISNPGPVGSAT